MLAAGSRIVNDSGGIEGSPGGPTARRGAYAAALTDGGGTLAAEGTSMPLSELAARQRCVRSNITQLVDRLEADGLVRREPDPDDRRSVRAALTPDGAARQKSGDEEVQRVKKAFLG